jgi:GTPase SAR1 family protein
MGAFDVQRDTAGADRYRNLLPMYYREADLAAVCYDTTDMEVVRIAYWCDRW